MESEYNIYSIRFLSLHFCMQARYTDKDTQIHRRSQAIRMQEVNFAKTSFSARFLCWFFVLFCFVFMFFCFSSLFSTYLCVSR